MNGVGASDSLAAPEAELPVNRWITGEVVETLDTLNRAFDELRFDDMADAIYHFVWGTFCDWYVELIKGAFDDETKRVAAWAFDQILAMLHPLMPFITEELWNAMGERPYDLIVARWPEPEAQVDVHAKAEIEWLIRFINEVRATRTALNVPPSAILEASQWNEGEQQGNWRRQHGAAIRRLSRVGNFKNLISSEKGGNSAQFGVDGATYFLDLEGVIDLDAEKSRLAKAAEAAEKDRDGLAARLANPAFAERAKPEAVEKARADHEAKSAEADRLRAALDRLG